MKLSKSISLEQRDFLERVIEGRRLKPADREEDRTRQFCRKRGLVVIEMKPRRWVLTDAGRAALRDAQAQEGGDGE